MASHSLQTVPCLVISVRLKKSAFSSDLGIVVLLWVTIQKGDDHFLSNSGDGDGAVVGACPALGDADLVNG